MIDKIRDILIRTVKDGIYLAETGGVTHIAGRVYNESLNRIMTIIDKKDKEIENLKDELKRAEDWIYIYKGQDKRAEKTEEVAGGENNVNKETDS